MATHPYEHAPDWALWRTAIGEKPMQDWRNLYVSKFSIGRDDLIATAGSCFAQHIGRELKARGYRYLDAEPAPPLLPEGRHGAFGYKLFSARYGNIYTTRQLIQLAHRVDADDLESLIWEQGGRFFDPFRPAIEPSGFQSREELLASRLVHHKAVKFILNKARVFVFTLGLTETWLDKSTGSAFPTCPGTVAGEFDPDRHVFHNLTFSEIMNDMEAFIALIRGRNPNVKLLLTVSPVPLTATATDRHVLVATTQSKSTLRAAAGELAAKYDFVDYFPSYEIVTAPASKGALYNANMRTVTPSGVAFVMSHFFRSAAANPIATSSSDAPDPLAAEAEAVELVCEEAMLDRAVVG